MRRLKDPKTAADLLMKRASAVIAYPTETYYGLGARITDQAGIERIIRIKGRDSAKGMIVLAGSIESALAVAEADSRQKALLMRLWPGAVSVLLAAREGLHPLLAPSGKVALRVSPHPLALALTQAAGPVTSTSATPSGARPASTPEEILQWGPDIDAILDGGRTPGGLPSTLADLTVWPPRCLREGALPFQAVLDAAGCPEAAR